MQKHGWQVLQNIRLSVLFPAVKVQRMLSVEGTLLEFTNSVRKGWVDFSAIPSLSAAFQV